MMQPRRLKKKSIKRLVEKHVAKAIEEYEKSRANLDSAGSSGGNPGNAGGTMNVHGCSHKTLHMKVECMQCALCIGSPLAMMVEILSSECGLLVVSFPNDNLGGRHDLH
ncbi:hypothetical protein Tco_1513751 [Tanacetum coccineum]